MKKFIYFITVTLMLVLLYQPSQAQDYPVAHNDTLEFTFPFEKDTLHIQNKLLANDYWPDSIDVNFFMANMPGFSQSNDHDFDTIALETSAITNEYFAQNGLFDAGSYYT